MSSRQARRIRRLVFGWSRRQAVLAGSGLLLVGVIALFAAAVSVRPHTALADQAVLAQPSAGAASPGFAGSGLRAVAVPGGPVVTLSLGVTVPSALNAQSPMVMVVAPGALASNLAADGIPSTALEAYIKAAGAAPTSCHISWTLVAAIGRVESNHGRFGNAVLHTDGRSTPPVIGPRLDGTGGNAVIRDTDSGRLDGDTEYDRAVGPMQFIPSTWTRWGQDGDGDGVKDPFDIYDAANATAKYLCAAGGDLSSAAGQAQAVFSYNHLESYVTAVLALAATYSGAPPEQIPTTAPPIDTNPVIEPIDPGPPPALEQIILTVSPPPGTTSSPATSTSGSSGPSSSSSGRTTGTTSGPGRTTSSSGPGASTGGGSTGGGSTGGSTSTGGYPTDTGGGSSGSDPGSPSDTPTWTDYPTTSSGGGWTPPPGPTDPGTTDPATIAPGTTDPGTIAPGTTDPGTTDPGTTDPGTTDTSTVSSTTDTSSTDPYTGGSATDTGFSQSP